jgi:GNAT superfamily N-acetyltransferase
MAISIRLARVSDADEISRLTAQLGYQVAASALRPRLARILARSDQQFLIAELDGRAVGWVHAAASEYIETEAFVVIAGLVVDGSHRRGGIGRMLIEHSEDWARKRGCSIVRLWSSAARTASHRFYGRLGYTKIKTQYSFAKSLDPTAPLEVTRFVPRVEG